MRGGGVASVSLFCSKSTISDSVVELKDTLDLALMSSGVGYKGTSLSLGVNEVMILTLVAMTK